MNNVELIKLLEDERIKAMKEYNDKVKKLNNSNNKVTYSLEDNDPECRFIFGYATGLNKAIGYIKQLQENRDQ